MMRLLLILIVVGLCGLGLLVAVVVLVVLLVKRLNQPPEPAGPAEVLRAVAPGESTITQDSIRPEEGGWRIDASNTQTLRLFEVELSSGVEPCMLTYRAQLKTEGLRGRAYLEMWCCLPGRGEFFSRGLQQPARGSTGWTRYETPFYLKKGQRPDLVKLNLVVEGPGTVWFRGVELLRTPLQS
jgi:hypothetical protein